jgi:iron complex outermembrane receptor protein
MLESSAKVLRVGGAIVSAAFSMSAIATEATTQPATLDEIIVTATKRQESIEMIPVSVSAVSGELLDRRMLQDFQDYLPTIPNIEGITPVPGQTRVIIRGINSGGLSASTGVYVDEAPYGSSSGLANGGLTAPDLDPWDMQRLEVLRGPQGTLYGASTLGGLVKFVTNAPELGRFDAKAEIAGETLRHGGDGESVKAMVNLPIGDTLALRISGYHRDDPGYIEDVFRHVDDSNKSLTTGGRAALLWEPAEDFRVTLGVLAQNGDLEAGSGVDVRMDAPFHIAQPFQYTSGPYAEARELPEFLDSNVRLYNATVNWGLGWADLTSSTSYDTYHGTSVIDESGTALGDGQYFFFTLDQEKVTQEIRLASSGSNNLDWLVGGFFTNEKGWNDADIGILPGYFGTTNYAPTTGAYSLDSTYKEYAGFGTLTYRFSPTVDLSVGARYAHNKQTGGGVTSTSTDLSLIYPGAPPYLSFSDYTGSSSQGVWTYSVAPSWRVTPDTMVYGRVATGYRPGGPNIQQPGLPFPAATTADRTTDYEIGVKGSYFEHTVTVDASAFWVNWSDIQLLEYSGGFSGGVNGGQARSEGYEWSIGWTPAKGLKVGFNGAYDNAYLVSAAPAAGGSAGSPLPYIPRWETSTTADYSWTVADAIRPFTGVTWNYMGTRYSDLTVQAQQLKLPSYNTVDLRAGVDLKRWSVELYAKNVGNARGINSMVHPFSALDGAIGTNGGYALVLINPLTLGIKLSVSF